MADKITADSNIMEIAEKYPKTIEVFHKYGLGCIGCVASRYETIGDVSKDGVDAKKFLADLNKAAGLK
jgi:hybrid cluster-associated redox disulfide protein